jgi:hypothetical protein
MIDKSKHSSQSDIPSHGALQRVKEFLAPRGTDYVIAIFTVVLAIVAVIQSFILYKQVDGMRKDQRPWIAVDVKVHSLKASQPVLADVTFVNSGKSPARRAYAEMVIKFVKNGVPPTIDYETQRLFMQTGVIYPNAPMATAYAMAEPHQTVEHLASAEEVDSFYKGESLLLTYGRVTYTDFFHIQHWSQFCTWTAGASAPQTVISRFSARPCTEYIDLDDN